MGWVTSITHQCHHRKVCFHLSYEQVQRSWRCMQGSHWWAKTCCWTCKRFDYSIHKKNLPFEYVLRVDDSKPLVSQVLAIYLHDGNISAELINQLRQQIANNFSEEWRFFMNWSAVSQVKQKSIAWKNYWRSKLTIPNHAFINPQKTRKSCR